MTDDRNGFGSMGKSFQEKLTHILIADHEFCDQISDVLEPKYFTLEYLEVITRKIFEYKTHYKVFPSADVLDMQLSQDEDLDSVVVTQGREFLGRIQTTSLNGDAPWVKDQSLDFCRKRALVQAMEKMLERVEESDYGSINRIVREALDKGAPRDAGHEYNAGLHLRAKRSIRQPISTGWPVLDKHLNGGWERATLTTFIAPTGAGKSMFLSNVTAAAVAQGLNAVYFTLEMADYKIGLRHDSYFSAVPINDIEKKQDIVSKALAQKLKGRLIIKEFPTKQASVQTLRAHLQRLETTKDFKADVVVVDYADLLRASRQYGEKRHELEGVYEELRGLAQEFNVVLVTADQTNRSGLDMEIVTIGQIGEAYAKATVCDLIMTISRRPEDKIAHTGRLFLAKSRLGQDGIVFPFLLNTATVKVDILEQSADPMEVIVSNNQNLQRMAGEAHRRLMSGSAQQQQSK